MKKFYRKALLREGFDENSEKYKEINRYFNRSSRQYQRDRKRREQLEVTFNSLSSFVNEDGELLDIFPSDENVEEKIMHEMELERLRDCLNRLPKEDRDLLYRVYGGDYGAIAEISREMGVSYNDLYYRIKKLLNRLRIMMHTDP